MAAPITTNGFETSIRHMEEKDLPGNANWVVQKYGGTSLGKFPQEIVSDIIVCVALHQDMVQTLKEIGLV